MVYASDVQENAPWGLARVSHKEHPTGNEAHTYSYPSSAGEGVTVYVVDTGINIKHVDFEGRAEWGATIPDGDEDVDGNGHGTHCAGTIAGRTYGVAKKAKVVAVKVLRSNGSGSMSDVIKGIEYVALQHEQKVKKDGKTKSVANMSLGGGRSYALDRVVNAAVDSGVVFAVAAGNDARNACFYSPAAASKPITVGASTIEDRNAWFSNHGMCVDVFAPGLDITSTWIGSDTATNTISGTSMASPHVAGLSAVILGEHEEPLSPQQVKDMIVDSATKGALKFSSVLRKTPNKLIFHKGTTPVETSVWEFTTVEEKEVNVLPSQKVVSQTHSKPMVRHNDLLVNLFHYPTNEHSASVPETSSPASEFLRIVRERLSERRLRQLVMQM
jgi:cerevisin